MCVLRWLLRELAITRRFFSFVNRRLAPADRVASLLDSAGQLVTDSAMKAELIGAQYSSVFVQDDGVLPPTFINNRESTAKLSSMLITVGDVLTALKSLNTSGAAGEDGIPPRFYFSLRSVLCEPLCRIFDASLSTGSLPQMWKLANVVPVPKPKGSPHDAASYRPIALTCVACKVMEQVICTRIHNFLSFQCSLNLRQHGFRPGLSCSTNLLAYLDYVTLSLNNRCPVDAIYFDVAKAFDSVSHPKLIHKLKALNISGHLATRPPTPVPGLVHTGCTNCTTIVHWLYVFCK